MPPVIFNLPLGSPSGLLIVRNPQPETTVPMVAVSQPAMAHGWSQFVPQPSSATGNFRHLSDSPPDSESLLLESGHVSRSPASVDMYHHCVSSVKNDLDVDKYNSVFDMGGFESGTVDHCAEHQVSDENKSSLPCDVLDDLLHIVNESLRPVVDDHSHSTDYDLTLDDDNSLISMVDSDVPSSTVQPPRNDTLPLAKITDYCPEWSYVEVLVCSSCGTG